MARYGNSQQTYGVVENYTSGKCRDGTVQALLADARMVNLVGGLGVVGSKSTRNLQVIHGGYLCDIFPGFCPWIPAPDIGSALDVLDTVTHDCSRRRVPC